MPKFLVHMQRWSEQTATVEIEAADIETAVDQANSLLDTPENITWGEGDELIYGSAAEIGDSRAYAAHDETGELVWERE